MYIVLAYIIKILHLWLIYFMLTVPFTKKLPWVTVLLHFIISFSLILHWVKNDNQCVFAQIEAYLMGVPLEKSFIHNLVSPVYRISDEQLSQILYIVTPLLGLVSFMRLFKHKREIAKEFINVFLVRTQSVTTI